MEGSPWYDQVATDHGLSRDTQHRLLSLKKWLQSWLHRATLLKVVMTPNLNISLHGATLLKVVVTPNLNISLGLFGGTNLFECKLDFRMNLLRELMRTELKQMLECSFQMCKFGTAVQFVMQYYHTHPVSKTNRRRHQVDGIASEP